MNIFRICLLLVMLSFSAVSWGSCVESCNQHGWDGGSIASCSAGCSAGHSATLQGGAQGTCEDGLEIVQSKSGGSADRYKRGFNCAYEGSNSSASSCTNSSSAVDCDSY